MPRSTHGRRRVVAVLLAALLALLAGASPASAQGGDNSATAVNEQDGTTQVDIAFDLRKVMNGIVDQTNAAKAYASCQECQSIAIAIQIVLVSGGVGDVLPVNTAEAINFQCDTCLAVAFAYQFVFGTGEHLRFTREARRQLAELAKAFRRLERSGASAQEVLSEADRLLRRLSDVLATGIEPVGRPQGSGSAPAGGEPAPENAAGGGGEAQPAPAPDDAATEGETPAPTASPDGEGTPAPTAPTTPTTTTTPTATPSPTTPSPTATASPTPSATATPEPSATTAPTASPSASATP